MTHTHNIEAKWNMSMQPIIRRIYDKIGVNCMQVVLCGLRDCLVYRPGSTRYTTKTDFYRAPVSDWLIADISLQTEGFAELADALLLD